MPSQEFEGVRPSHLSHLASKSRKQHSATWHRTLRPAIELARHWDSQSAWHRRTGQGRRGTLRQAWAEPGPASLLGFDLLCQAVSDPSLSHSRKRRSDCRWQLGPEWNIQTHWQVQASDDRRPGTRQGGLE